MNTTTSVSGLPGLSTELPTPTPQPTRPPRAPKPADKRGWWWGTGRRKAAVARIRMKPCDAADAGIQIEAPKGDTRNVERYFAEERDRNEVTSPLSLTGMMGRIKVVAKVHGGGFMGQAAAIKLAIARALRDYDPTLESQLRDAGMLTRDSRKVERKKYGQAGARRRFQFSKR